MEKRLVTINEVHMITGAIILAGLLVLGHDVMKHGYSMRISNSAFNCVITPTMLEMND